MDKDEKKKLLAELKAKMGKDYSLPLRKGTKNLVFGEGDIEAEVMFIGEGPGYWEDMKGRPFVGNAGALLGQALYSIKLSREKVFITNVVHFRPPENRDPLPQEIEAFAPYLDKMIEIINPKVIVTLGRFSMAKFIPLAKITAIHGRAQRVNWKDKAVVVVPMFHPAAGLRSEEVKRKFLEDFHNLVEVLKSVKEETVKKSEQMQLV